MSACRRAHSSALLMRRCTGNSTGRGPHAARTVRPFRLATTAQPHCDHGPLPCCEPSPNTAPVKTSSSGACHTSCRSGTGTKAQSAAGSRAKAL
eukprot:700885-Lingulodinium_polyedra.AAC.1